MALSRRRMLAATQGDAGEDGDFVQLRNVRERRQAERAKTGFHAEGASEADGAIIEEHAKSFRDEPKPRPSTAARNKRLEDLMNQLFGAVDRDDKITVMELALKLGASGDTSVLNIRKPDTDENILHYALSKDKKDIAMALVSSANEALLTSHHKISRSGISGRNNSLHIITEKNDIEMAKFFLSRLDTKEKKLDVMKLETAVDIQGQRPRLFSCLHLAAYFGHTELVRLYLDTGLGVNHLNGKKDTALLWAARWGHNETVSVLLDRGADTEVMNDKGSTALYWAIRYEFPKTVALLIQKGKANPNTTRKLGLVAPIIITAAYGNVEIMSLLLQHPDINIHFKIRGGEMAVHHAAREGCPNILEMLIKRGANFDEQDEIGDTPLLLAAKYGNYDIVQDLIRKGANVNHRNHEGHDAWYFAIEDEEDNSLLQALLTATRGQDKEWRQPLCIAAANGRAKKVDFILKMHISPTSADLDGNTFLHHAAMSNQYEIIEKFHSIISINVENNRGNTPLHIACFRGYSQTIETLIKCKAKADVKNKKGETALHVAAYSKHITAEAVRMLVDYTIKSHAWESLNAKDYEGNNALHIAGKHAQPEVLWEFRQVRFKDRDKDGLIPLHEAVRPGEPEALETMLDIFESMKRDARINEQTYATSETVLHLAAEEGHANCVKRLIALGADIAIKDMYGDTVLHRLTKATVEASKNMSRHLEVFDMVLENVVKWWCIKKNIPFPEEENQEVFMAHRRDAILFVSNEIRNNDGLSVLDQAFKSGSPEVLSRLLMMEDVTLFEQSDEMPFTYSFDITSITPRTNNKVQGCCGGQGRVSPMENANSKQSDDNLSGLEWLITHTAKTRAAEILDLPPVKMIENYYTSMVAWTFALLMIVHIVYMSVFTYVAVDLLGKLREDSSLINASDPETILLYVFVPLEPLVIVLYVFITVVRYCFTGDINRRSRLSRKHGIARVVSIVSAYLFMIICVVFAALVFAWIGLFTTRYSYNDYIVAAALCIGWLITISFTRGIQAIHYFYRMLLSMILRDVVRFMIVYLFVIMAFGFAFHVLFQISADSVANYPTPGESLFLTFNMMIGMGELFDGTFEANMAAVGRTATYAKAFYLIYVILSTIILLNLLIAMMNDSYSMILKENAITWRIESVSLGVEIEAAFPMARVFSRVKLSQGGLGTVISPDRWRVTMTDTEYRERMRDMDTKYSKYTDVVSRRLDDIDSRMTEMEKLTTTKLQQISELLDQIKKQR